LKRKSVPTSPASRPSLVPILIHHHPVDSRFTKIEKRSEKEAGKTRAWWKGHSAPQLRHHGKSLFARSRDLICLGGSCHHFSDSSGGGPDRRDMIVWISCGSRLRGREMFFAVFSDVSGTRFFAVRRKVDWARACGAHVLGLQPLKKEFFSSKKREQVFFFFGLHSTFLFAAACAWTMRSSHVSGATKWTALTVRKIKVWISGGSKMFQTGIGTSWNKLEPFLIFWIGTFWNMWEQRLAG